MTGNRKMKGFYVTTAVLLFIAVILAFKMPAQDLITLCQFYFGAQGLVTTAFFGGNFGEHWAANRKG